MAKTVIVLGGSLGGLAVTHRLLKHTRQQEKDLKVILVSKNSHFYWNLASVRAVVPGLVKDEELLQPIEPGLAQYPAGSVEFIVGAATALDPAAKTVRVSPGSSSATDGGEERVLAYDYLVLATGADAADRDMPWKAAGSYEDLVASLHGTAERIRAAQHIVVAGGGATGVELAAEIKDALPDKTVVLLNAGDCLVGGDSTAGALDRELRRLGVDVRHGTRADRVDAGRPDGKTLVSLSGGGDDLLTDFYLPTTGLLPNTGFVPKDLLTPKGYADVDDCMRVRSVLDVWAVGDVVSKPRAGFLFTESQAAGVVKNIGLALQGKEQRPVSGPPVDVFICAVGRGRGVGRLGPVPVPSFFVWAAKGRTLGMERTPKYASGSMF